MLEVIKSMMAEVVTEAAAAVAQESRGWWHDPANAASLANLTQSMAQMEARKVVSDVWREGPPKAYLWDEKAQAYRFGVVPRGHPSHLAVLQEMRETPYVPRPPLHPPLAPPAGYRPPGLLSQVAHASRSAIPPR
jgi:hypothetical protein